MFVLSLALTVLLAPQAQETQVITTVPNVRLRDAPSLSSKVLREDELGTVHKIVGRTDGWLHVDLHNAVGYVREELTAPITPATRPAVIERIIKARIERNAGGFAEWNQLLRLIQPGLHASGDRETTARFALHELQALRGAADAAGQAFRTVFAFRLAEQSEMFVNHEPAGQWILRRDYILAVHDRFKDTAAADDIAWFAAQNGLPGECEGYLPCYVTWLNLLQGEYFRRHPAGRHTESALARIVELFAYWDPPKIDDTGLPKGTTCADLKAPLDELQQAVVRVNSPRKGPAVRVIEQVAAACR